MKGELKRSITFLMVLALIFNICITTYADVAIPSNLIQTQGKGTGDAGAGEEQLTVSEEVYGRPIVQKDYEILCLLKGTDEPVPGLDTVNGSGEVGSIIRISHPSIDGYQVLDGQPASLVIDEDEELNKVVVYYKPVEAVVESTSLTINHIYYSNDEKVTEVQIIEGLAVGTIIDSAEHSLDRDGLEYAGSDKESLVISATESNEITIYYNKAIEKEEEPIDEIGSVLIKAGSLRTMSSLIATGSGISREVLCDKSAEWVDRDAGLAKIVFTINGVPVQVSGADVVLVLDTSGSMEGTKLTDTKAAAKAFVTELYKPNGDTASDNRLAIVEFTYYAVKYPNVGSNQENLLGVNNTANGQLASAYFNGKIDAMVAGRGTNYDEAFKAARDIINGRKNKTRPTYIVFMSDGEPNGYWVWDGFFTGHFEYYDGQNVASALRNSGTIIYSLGLGLEGNSFTQFIVPLASDPKEVYAIEVTDSTDLTPIFTGIAGKIKAAGTNAVITDLIQTEYFQITTKPGTTISYEASHGTVSIEANESIPNGKVIWDVGDITSTTKTLTIYIQLNDTITVTGSYPTNISASLSYTNYNNGPEEEAYPVPELNVEAVTYTVNYYRDGASTAFDTASGEVIVTDPVVSSVSYANMPAGYKVDETASTVLPFTVTANANVISVYYEVDQSQQFSYTVNYYIENTTTPVPGITPNPVTRTGYLGESITEYPVYAEGYSPLDYYSKTIVLAVSGNVINFYYTANEYNVNYDGGDDDGTGSLTDPNSPYKYGAEVTVLNNGEDGFKKAGYHVIGWNRFDELSQVYVSAALQAENVPDYVYGDKFMMPAYDVTLVAQWALTDYTLTINYEYEDGTEAKPTYTEYLNMGDTYSVNSQEILGYTADKAVVSGTMEAANLEVTVVYTPRTDITYNVNYLASGTTTAVAPAKVVENQTFGATVTEAAISISGYNMIAPTSATITLGVEGNVINFYYSVIREDRERDKEDKEDKETEKFVEIVDEEIPLAVPELNKAEHYQYLQGYPDNTIRPEGNITREEVAAVFYRLLTVDYRGSIMTLTHNFSDVPENGWSTKYIATLANGGILEGNPDGTFEPHEFITKAELAVIASKFDNLSPFSGDEFSDISEHWANKYINSAAKKGWVKGNTEGYFYPDKYITRAEFASLVNNVLGRKVHKENILPDAKKFPDLFESQWYYEAMQEAVNSHYYLRLEDNYEKWTEIYYPELGF